MIKVFLSFSGILSMARNQTLPADDSDSLYVFGCSKEGIERTIKLYGTELPGETVAGIMKSLADAEAEGRVRWADGDGRFKREMEWLHQAMESLGVLMVETPEVMMERKRREATSWGSWSYWNKSTIVSFLKESSTEPVLVYFFEEIL
jgi:hypothetical protein